MCSIASKLRNSSPSKSLRKAYAIVDGESLRGAVELRLKKTRKTNMNIKSFKTTALSFALAAAFLVTAGAAESSNAFAQDWRWRDRDRDDCQDNRRERFEER